MIATATAKAHPNFTKWSIMNKSFPNGRRDQEADADLAQERKQANVTAAES
jgi:hypothetical protein